jgi:hypothetical protein
MGGIGTRESGREWESIIHKIGHNIGSNGSLHIEDERPRMRRLNIGLC